MRGVGPFLTEPDYYSHCLAVDVTHAIYLLQLLLDDLLVDVLCVNP
jgi:hypothetical protein